MIICLYIFIYFACYGITLSILHKKWDANGGGEFVLSLFWPMVLPAIIGYEITKWILS